MSRAQSVDVLWSGIRASSGAALSGGKVYTYLAGTTTEVSLYADQSKATYQTNPIVLDSEGKAEAWGDGAYKFVIKTSADVSVDTIDNLIYGFEDPTTVWGGTSTGTDTCTLSPSPALTSYVNGTTISYIVLTTNTGAVTMNVSALGAKDIKKTSGGSKVALAAGDLVAGNVVSITYDGAGYFILNTSNAFTSISVSGAATCGSVSTAQLTHTSNMTIDPSGTLAIAPTSNLTIGPSGAAEVYLQSGGAKKWTMQSNGDIYPQANGAGASAGQDLGSTLRYLENIYTQDLIVNGSVLAPSGAGAVYIGVSGASNLTITSSGQIWPGATSATADLGKSNYKWKDVHFYGLLKNGSAKYISTNSFTPLRNITHPTSTLLDGGAQSTVDKATLVSHLQYIYQLIATIWLDNFPTGTDIGEVHAPAP